MLQLLVIAGALTAARSAFAGEPSIHDAVQEVLQGMEIQPQAEEPVWAKFESPPLFTFVWMSDFHLDGSRLELVKQAFRYVDQELAAHFVMITGDNNAYAPEFEHQGRVPPVTLRRQIIMQRFLDQNLHTPYVIIPGDDWPQDFEKVFGAFQFSFDFGGMHFLFTAPDRCTYGVEGRAVFDEPTWDWMRLDLKRNKDRPTLFMMHETIAPPSFLDADKTRRMLEEHPNVIASFCGHLHADVAFEMARRGQQDGPAHSTLARRASEGDSAPVPRLRVGLVSGGLKYLVCPGLGLNPRHGFKVVKVYRKALILRTVEYNAEKRQFEKVMKWQRVDIPESFQAGLHEPKGRRFKKQNYSELPPHPRKSDPQLIERSLELVGPLMRFLGESMISTKP